MDATQIPKGRSQEVYTDGRPLNLPGIYRHKDTAAEFITSPGSEGVLQADALMNPIWKDAWERVGEVPSRQEILARQKLQLAKDLAAEKVGKEQEDSELQALIAQEKEKAGQNEVESKESVAKATVK